MPLAQANLFGLDSLFFLTILFIFGTAIVTALLTKWSKDKCLKFFRNHAVTVQRDDGQCVWGTLRVYSLGVEVDFRTPGVDRIGRRRSSVMIYPTELDTKTLAIFRLHDTLSPEDQADRTRQASKTFNPGFLHRTLRKLRNLINTLRDAFSKALGAFVGQIAKANPTSRVLSTQQAGVTQIGDTVLTQGLASNAYEPMLEHHIGKPVILDINRPGGGTIGFAGYLAEYTSKFIAVFNVEHETAETLELALPKAGETQPACVKLPEAGAAGCAVELHAEVEGGRISVRNAGFDAALLESAEREGFEPAPLNVLITPGAKASLPAVDLAGARVTARRVRRLDVVAPRTQAVVRHAGELLPRRSFLDELGLDELPLIPKRKSTRNGEPATTAEPG